MSIWIENLGYPCSDAVPIAGLENHMKSQDLSLRMQSGGPDPEPLSKSENRLLKKYGKLPRGGLLAQKPKERTYFDSGDFALSAADRETDNGAIQTGRDHPHRESISHPYASIPASSNVDEDANQDTFRKSASLEESPLLQQTDIKDEPTNKVGQDEHVSHEC